MPTNLQKNLNLLCDRHRTAAETCRDLDINRLQFNRYLNGKTRPSKRIMRKICDYFGVNDDEMEMPHAQFSALVRPRPRASSINGQTTQNAH